MTTVFRQAVAAAVLGALVLTAASIRPAFADDAPHIYLDKSPAIIRYQLQRLTLDQLLKLQRSPDNPKYKPIYEAILTHKGLPRPARADAVAALTKLDHTGPVKVILTAVGQVDSDDTATLGEVVSLLLDQPATELAASHDTLEHLVADADSDHVKSAAYAALAVADVKPDAAWALASKNDGGTALLLAAIPDIPSASLRSAFYTRVEPLAANSSDAAVRTAALTALGTMGHHASAFKTLAAALGDSDAHIRFIASKAIHHIPSMHWPQGHLAAAAAAVIRAVKATPEAERTDPESAEVIQLGYDLASAMPHDAGMAVRHELRELAVQVVVIRTLREQMHYDTRWFAVQAGKPIQITLDNSNDTMQHNLVISQPGTMQQIAAAGLTLVDKGYIPDSPLIVAHTNLLNPGETQALNFIVPEKPGEYPFFCSFPAHDTMMYGTMLVVKDLDTWEAHPTVPTDLNPLMPGVHKPYASQKNLPLEGGPAHPMH